MAYLTGQELLERFEYYTLEIENRIKDEEDVESLLDEIPYSISLHHPQTSLR